MFFWKLHELHSLLLMCICFFLFSCCFFVVVQVFPRYARLTLLPAPGHIPPFIPQVPMVTRAMMLRRCQCHRHHQRRFRQKQIRQRCGLGFGLEGDLRNGRGWGITLPERVGGLSPHRCFRSHLKSNHRHHHLRARWIVQCLDRKCLGRPCFPPSK